MGLRAIILSVLFACLMAVVNVYLGLKVGMTVSASIPVAVLAMLVLKIFKTSDIFESNLIQTAASAGESLAAGFIFTVPALLILGFWSKVDYWLSVVVLASGGLLGVLFSIPFRKVLFKRKELSYPEGTATAEILLASQASSGKLVLYGALAGAIVKFFQSGLGVLVETVQGVYKLGGWVIYGGASLSPALLGVGYIVGVRVALSVFLGGVISWLIILPLMWESGAELSIDAVYSFWSSYIRFIGVGAMSVGGIWTLYSVRDSFSALVGLETEESESGEDLSRTIRLGLFVLSMLGIIYVLATQVDSLVFSLLFVLVVLVSTFLFSVVSAYMAGLVGSSNNPVSGITIATVLFFGILISLLGASGMQAVFMTITIGAFVCAAAAISGDNLQDLKTGQLIGATPYKQQTVQVIGVFVAALIIPPILDLLAKSYTIGSEAFPAPQASLVAAITEGVFSKDLPWDFVAIGAGIAIANILFNTFSPKKIPVLALAVGTYLPFVLGSTLLLGALFNRGSKSTGVLIASGLICGEALLGVIIAALVGFGFMSA